ncbi:MAG: type II toxin-antitoxin system prevent-host-death family antitoxin, partial [Ilumatobacteraceae bacterium]
EYLRAVADGTTLTVTDRGVPVVVISPVAPRDPLAAGVEEGWIRPPAVAGAIGHVPRARSQRRVLDSLRDDRGE